jgi:plastocyanin
MATDRLGRLPTIVLALVVPLVALVTVLVTLNVTDDPSSSAAAGGAGGAGGKSGSGTAISIKNFQYSPNPISVKVGAKVLVTNDDGTVHTLTADDKSFDTGDLDGGAAKPITISKPGKYTYHCTIHNYMTGTIEAK